MPQFFYLSRCVCYGTSQRFNFCQCIYGDLVVLTCVALLLKTLYVYFDHTESVVLILMAGAYCSKLGCEQPREEGLMRKAERLTSVHPWSHPRPAPGLRRGLSAECKKSVEGCRQHNFVMSGTNWKPLPWNVLGIRTQKNQISVENQRTSITRRVRQQR